MSILQFVIYITTKLKTDSTVCISRNGDANKAYLIREMRTAIDLFWGIIILQFIFLGMRMQ